MYRLLASSDLKADDVRRYIEGGFDDGENTIGGGDAAATGTAPNAGVTAVKFESLDLIELGPLILLTSAEERTQTLLAEATAEAQRLREHNVADACAEAREAAKRELLPSLVAFADAGQALILLEQQLLARSAPRLVQLALEIAEKTIGRAVAEYPDIVSHVLERAKQEVSEAKQLRIWLNPADHAVLAEMRPDLIQVGSRAGRSIEVVSSEEISRGGCRLETESGVVDATIPTQLDEIRRQLLDEK